MMKTSLCIIHACTIRVCLYRTRPTLIMGAESTVTMVVISHKMESKPVLVADDGRRDITA